MTSIVAERTYTVDAACQNCGWRGKLTIRFREKAPTGGIAGSKRTCDRCGVYAVTTMSDERRKGVDMRPCAGDEVNAAWAEVNRLRSRLAEVEADEQRAREELVRELVRVLEAAQRLEAEVERLCNGLADLADLHHRTVAGSKKHDPEHVTNFRDCPCKPCQRAAALLDGRETGPERAWAIAERAEAERDRLRSECAVCEKCGHVQAEPNWCHECGHRTTPPVWAKPLLDAFFERNDLAERAERAEAALREIASCKSHHPGDCPDIAQKALASVPSSLDAPPAETTRDSEPRCEFCGDTGLVRIQSHEDYGVSFESETCEACDYGQALIAADEAEAEVERLRERLAVAERVVQANPIDGVSVQIARRWREMDH